MKLTSKRSKQKYCVILLLGLVVAFAVLGFLFQVFSKTTKEYNRAIENYNSSAQEYNRIVEDAYVESISGLYEELPILPEVEENANSLFGSLMTSS